jgi:uncharacterized membrane protein
MTSPSLDLAAPLLFGAATGLRTTLPLAVLAARSPRAAVPLQALMAAAAVGELVFDKLPGTPSRLLPAGLLARVTAAAIGSALLGRRSGHPLLSGTLGALAAVGGAVVGYSLRQRAQLDTGTPDLPWAVAEDGVCLLLAREAVG